MKPPTTQAMRPFILLLGGFISPVLAGWHRTITTTETFTLTLTPATTSITIMLPCSLTTEPSTRDIISTTSQPAPGSVSPSSLSPVHRISTDSSKATQTTGGITPVITRGSTSSKAMTTSSSTRSTAFTLSGSAIQDPNLIAVITTRSRTSARLSNSPSSLPQSPSMSEKSVQSKTSPTSAPKTSKSSSSAPGYGHPYQPQVSSIFTNSPGPTTRISSSSHYLQPIANTRSQHITPILQSSTKATIIHSTSSSFVRSTRRSPSATKMSPTSSGTVHKTSTSSSKALKSTTKTSSTTRKASDRSSTIVLLADPAGASVTNPLKTSSTTRRSQSSTRTTRSTRMGVFSGTPIASSRISSSSRSPTTFVLSSRTILRSRFSTKTSRSTRQSTTSVAPTLSNKPSSHHSSSTTSRTSTAERNANAVDLTRISTSISSTSRRRVSSATPGVSGKPSSSALRSRFSTKTRRSTIRSTTSAAPTLSNTPSSHHSSSTPSRISTAERNANTIDRTRISTRISRTSRRRMSTATPTVSGKPSSSSSIASATKSSLPASSTVKFSITTRRSRSSTRSSISTPSQSATQILSIANPSNQPTASTTIMASSSTASCSVEADLLNGGFETGCITPWSEPVFLETSVSFNVIESDTECRTGGSCLVNGIYDGSNNMFQQSINACGNTNYVISAYAKASTGMSQCYLQVCINSPKLCSGPVAIQETYTLATVEFNLPDTSRTAAQVYTECIGNSNDVLSVFIDDIVMRSV